MQADHDMKWEDSDESSEEEDEEDEEDCYW
jgi:hypothetical protein